MTTIDVTARRDRIADDFTAPAASSARPKPASDDARLEHALERVPVSPDYHAFLARLGSQEAPLASEAPRAERVAMAKDKAAAIAAQQRLDQFRARFSGPYDVKGVSGAKVEAAPMFRMNTPDAFNAKKAAAHAKELDAICARAGIAGYAGLARCGRPSPEQLVAVTQALLDAGKLPAADASHASVGSRIRAMQWEWGIGVDCAGYTQQAAAAAHGNAGAAFKANLMGDIFTGMGADGRFRKVSVGDIRPGDVIHLDNPRRGEVGHNVVVYDHRTLDDATRSKIVAGGKDASPAAKAFLSGKGPFHAFEVDSSWGAGDGQPCGGFRRDVWVYDEGSCQWGTFADGDREKGTFLVDPLTGPQGELFAGAYRPKGVL